MIAKVMAVKPQLPPEPVIVLEMSPKEFAGLFHLHMEYGGGPPSGVRGDVDRGLEMAMDSLPEPWNSAVRACKRERHQSYIYDAIDRSWDVAISVEDDT